MLKRNIISSFMSNGYLVVLQFALVPILLKYLGGEAYGLIGIYIALIAALNIFDMGLSPALLRELSRLSASRDSENLMRKTVTTLESVYFVIAIFIIGIFYFGAPLITEYWLNKTTLPAETITACLRLNGLQCAMQFLTNYYTNGLNGLQRMITSNGALVINHTLRALAGFFVLIVMSADIKVYFFSKFLSTFLGFIMTAFLLYRALPVELNSALRLNAFDRFKSRFSLERINACKRFAGGMAITSLLTFFIMQIDKIILTRLVTLEQFGYYTVAISVAITLSASGVIISRAILPIMTKLVAGNEIEALKKLYLNSSALVGWLILPISGTLILFSHQFLTLYLGNTKSVFYIEPIFEVLMIGFALHGLMYVPYSLSLAFGWTRFGINISIVAMLFMTPITIVSTMKYGVMGAAGAWVVLSLGYFSLSMYYLHLRCLPKVLLEWYRSIILPIVLFVLILSIRYFWN